MIHACPLASPVLLTSSAVHVVVTICVIPSNDFTNPTSYEEAPLVNSTRNGFVRVMVVEPDPSTTPTIFVYVVVVVVVVEGGTVTVSVVKALKLLSQPVPDNCVLA